MPVSDLCDKYGIKPGVFYRWQRDALDNLERVLEDKRARRSQAARERKLERENEALKQKLAEKDSVIAEISEVDVANKERMEP